MQCVNLKPYTPTLVPLHCFGDGAVSMLGAHVRVGVVCTCVLVMRGHRCLLEGFACEYTSIFCCAHAVFFALCHGCPPPPPTPPPLLRVFASRERCAPPSAVYVCLCTGNHNGTLVFGASPLQGTIPPGGEQKVTVSFSPDHPSRAEFQSTFRCVFVCLFMVVF